MEWSPLKTLKVVKQDIKITTVSGMTLFLDMPFITVQVREDVWSFLEEAMQ